MLVYTWQPPRKTHTLLFCYALFIRFFFFYCLIPIHDSDTNNMLELQNTIYIFLEYTLSSMIQCNKNTFAR